MKLGISYIAFSGEELLQYAIRSIRGEVAFVSVVYQTTSFYGDKAHPELLPTLTVLAEAGLINGLVHFEPDLSLGSVVNEVRARNIGLEESRKAGCSHHISADTDELYDPSQLAYAKTAMSGHDCSVAEMETYYKKPTYRIHPSQNHTVSLIHPVSTCYDTTVNFPFTVDITRKCNPCSNCLVLSKSDFVVHHMSYVRKDLHRKMRNSRNGVDVDKIVSDFCKYEVGGRLQIPPDFVNRRTVLVENQFGIDL